MSATRSTIKITIAVSVFWLMGFVVLNGQDYPSLRLVSGVYTGHDMIYSQGNYYLTCRTRDTGEGEDFAIVKLDSNFNVIWSKSYGGDSEGFANRSLANEGGDVLTLGYTRSYGNTSTAGYVQKINENGELLWAHQYFENRSMRVEGFWKKSNNHYLMSGYLEAGIRQEDRVIDEIDDDGKLLTAHLFDCDSLSEIGQGITQTSDGGYVLTSAIHGGDGFGGSDLEVLKVSADYEIEWAKRIGGDGTEIDGKSPSTDVLEIGGGYIVYSSTDKTNQASFDAYDLMFMKLDRDGELVWSKSLGSEFDDFIGTGSFELVAPNKIIMFISVFRDQPEIYESKLVEMDTMGTIVSVQDFNPPNSEGFHFITQSKNDHWVASGFIGLPNGEINAAILVLPDSGQLCVQDPAFTTLVEDTEFRPFVKDMTCERYLEVDYAEVTPIVEDINVTSELNCVGEIPPLLVGEQESEETSNAGIACLAGSIELRTFNGEGVVWWTDETEQVELAQKETVAVVPTSFDDIVVVAHDEWGRTANFTITVEECRPVIVYELLTPNGDGSNDYFVVDQVPKDAVLELTVLNTWGDVLYENSDYDNKWDGGELNSGNYFYTLKVNGELYKGPLVIRQ